MDRWYRESRDRLEAVPSDRRVNQYQRCASSTLLSCLSTSSTARGSISSHFCEWRRRWMLTNCSWSRSLPPAHSDCYSLFLPQSLCLKIASLKTFTCALWFLRSSPNIVGMIILYALISGNEANLCFKEKEETSLFLCCSVLFNLVLFFFFSQPSSLFVAGRVDPGSNVALLTCTCFPGLDCIGLLCGNQKRSDYNYQPNSQHPWP